MIRRDLKSNLDAAQSLAPAARTAAANGTGVDLAGYGSALILLALGLWTDGSFTFSVEESDDNSAFTAVASGDLLGAFTVVDGTDDDNTIQRVGYVGTKRYIRVAVAQGASPAPSTGLVCSAEVLRGHPDVAPLA